MITCALLRFGSESLLYYKRGGGRKFYKAAAMAANGNNEERQKEKKASGKEPKQDNSGVEAPDAGSWSPVPVAPCEDQC